MAPLDAHVVDQPVSGTGQLVATVLTFGLASVALVYLVLLWRREGIVWQFILAASGASACLMEPLFDHLYGLRFYEEGQWHLYTAFGSAQPIWVPAAYLAYYGGASVFIARTLARRPEMRTVWIMYAAVVAMSLAAELTYVSVLDVYRYQDSQPFVVLGYPVFLAFTNAMAALVAGIVAFRLVPMMRTAGSQLALLLLVPCAFALDLFGTGILYLSVRHGFQDPPMVLVHVAAVSVAVGIFSVIRLLGVTLVLTSPRPAGRPGEADQGVPP